MPLFKATFSAVTEIDVWVEADDAAHAQALVAANDSDTYGRIRSSVSVESGSIRVNTPSINAIVVEQVS